MAAGCQLATPVSISWSGSAYIELHHCKYYALTIKRECMIISVQKCTYSPYIYFKRGKESFYSTYCFEI